MWQSGGMENESKAPDPPEDRISQKTGVLTRRETEARILAPVIEALGEEFGRDQVVKIVREVIIGLARKEGARLAKEYGSSVDAYVETTKFWRKDGALEIEVLEQSEDRFDYNVTRCRYAEMYKALGIPELGAVLSCNRDYSLIEGFNPDVTLTRDQTIMEGADCCTFRYDFSKAGGKAEKPPS